MTIGLLCATASNAQVYLPPGADLAVHPGDTVSIFCNVMNSGRWGTLSQGVVDFYGTQWRNTVGSELPDQGTFRFLQTTPQYLYGGNFPGIVVANPAGVILNTDIKVRYRLHFDTGYLFLNGSNLVIARGGIISGYSDQRFVVTGSEPQGGSLYRDSVSGSDRLVTFPIGAYPGSYTPLALETHTAYPMTFHARVFDSVYAEATAGATNPETVVLKTWNLGQPGLNIADVSVWLQHDVQEEGRSFPLHRDSSYVSLYTGARWDTTGPKGVLSPGPLTTSPPQMETYVNLRNVTSALLTNAYLSVATVPWPVLSPPNGPKIAIVCSPNPAPGIFDVHISGEDQLVHMVMYEVAGRRVYARDINGNATISVPWLPPGVYILVFYDGRGRIGTPKMILLRK